MYILKSLLDFLLIVFAYFLLIFTILSVLLTLLLGAINILVILFNFVSKYNESIFNKICTIINTLKQYKYYCFFEKIFDITNTILVLLGSSTLIVESINVLSDTIKLKKASLIEEHTTVFFILLGIFFYLIIPKIFKKHNNNNM